MERGVLAYNIYLVEGKLRLPFDVSENQPRCPLDSLFDRAIFESVVYGPVRHDLGRRAARTWKNTPAYVSAPQDLFPPCFAESLDAVVAAVHRKPHDESCIGQV